MDPKGGARVCKEIREERGQLTDADLLVTSIPKAGHYPFLDQPDLFMKALLQQTQPYRCDSFLLLWSLQPHVSYMAALPYETQLHRCDTMTLLSLDSSACHTLLHGFSKDSCTHSAEANCTKSAKLCVMV